MNIQEEFSAGSFEINYEISDDPSPSISATIYMGEDTVSSFILSEEDTRSAEYSNPTLDQNLSCEVYYLPAKDGEKGLFRFNRLNYTERNMAPLVLTNFILCEYDDTIN